MKKITLLFVLFTSFGFSQTTTGTVSIGTLQTIKIDTDATNVTLTLTGPSNAWFGVGFGGSSMSSVTDMFIWNSSADRDYTPSGFQSDPSPDASQSWTINSDNVSGSVRTIIATRTLASAGDFTFTNTNTNINIIYASGSSATLGGHGGNPHSSQTLTRTTLGTEDFSLNASALYPNPTKGLFTIDTKTALSEISIYTHAGQFVKTVKVGNTLSTNIDVADLQTGIYLLELKNETDKSWKKIIIE